MATTTSEKKINIYQKIQQVKAEILKANLKKSGWNKFAGFDYYELSDIMPAITELCNQNGLFTHITFNNEYATLTIVNIDNPEETIQYHSPMRELELKGCNAIQSLGGIESYQRRYLHLMCWEISEADLFDSVSGKEDAKKDAKKEEKKDEPKWFNKEDLERLQGNAEYLKKFATSDDLIKDVQKFYAVSKDMKMKIADARASIE